MFPGVPTSADGKVGAFARQAILHQPLDYARTVAKDVVRYFDPNVGFNRPLSGDGPDAMSFHPRPATPNTEFAANVDQRYHGLNPMPKNGTSLLVTYQAIMRLNGLVLLALIVLTAIAVWRCRGIARITSVICAVFAAILLILPPAVSSYDARYALPPAALLAVSACLGISALVARSRTGSERAL